MAKPTVYLISAVRRSLIDDQATRARRYFISMGLRTVCFATAAFVEGATRWLLVVLAVFLPWFAVVFANASRENSHSGASYLPPTPELGEAGGSTDR